MHSGRGERGRDHQGRRMDVSKGQEDTQVLLSCEHRGGALPELYECEPLSARIEAVMLLMKRKLHLPVKTWMQAGGRFQRGYVLCSRGVGLWSCLRCEFGEARGSGMEDTSWV